MRENGKGARRTTRDRSDHMKRGEESLHWKHLRLDAVLKKQGCQKSWSQSYPHQQRLPRASLPATPTVILSPPRGTVCGKLGLGANVMMELRVRRWGPRSVMLCTVRDPRGASSWTPQSACFLHKIPSSTYFSNLFQERLNIVCSSALIHTSQGTLSL